MVNAGFLSEDADLVVKLLFIFNLHSWTKYIFVVIIVLKVFFILGNISQGTSLFCTYH